MTIHANGESTHQLVYFTTGVGELYLSKDALIKLKVIPADFPRIGSVNQLGDLPEVSAKVYNDDVFNKVPAGDNFNEVQCEFSPALLQRYQRQVRQRYHAPPVPGVNSMDLQHALPLQGPTVNAPVHVQPGLVAPTPNCLPVRFAPSIPLGMTSLGSRTRAMEGCAQVGAGVEPGAPQRVEPSAPPAPVNPIHMVTTLNSDRVPTVRVAPPPVATKVMDSPQDRHVHALPPQNSHQVPLQHHGASQGNDINFQAQLNQRNLINIKGAPGYNYYSGNPTNKQGIPSTQAHEIMSENVQSADVGPECRAEFTHIRRQTPVGGTLYKVQDEFSSERHRALPMAAAHPQVQP